MISFDDVKDIKLLSSYREFCKSQENCVECVLSKRDFINSGYDQPCEQIYDLLKIIFEMYSKSK